MIAATCRRISEELGGTCPDLGRQPTSVSWSAMTLPERHGCSRSFSGRFRGVNADLPGMCSRAIHANNAREALVKMCTLPLLAGVGVVLIAAGVAAILGAIRPG